MFNQFLGHSNYHSYNIRIATVFGLEAAVYLNAILSINSETEEMKVDRAVISSITTLSSDTQKEMDKIFSKVGIIEVVSSDMIKINYKSLFSLFDLEYNNEVEKIAPMVTKKRTKKDAIKEELKKLVKTTNGELRDAYSDWIDSVFAKQGWMSKKSIELGQKLLDDYSNHNLDLALELLNIASIGGYRDIQWAINSYEENKNKSNRSGYYKAKPGSSNLVIPVELDPEVF